MLANDKGSVSNLIKNKKFSKAHYFYYLLLFALLNFYLLLSTNFADSENFLLIILNTLGTY